MTSEKLDRRKKYTRMVLKDSLMQLLKEKPLSSITVKEICEMADINRSTFYAHYPDQYALLTQIEDELIEDLKHYLNTANLHEEDEAIDMTVSLLDYFSSKHEECLTLLNERADSTFQQKVTNVAESFMIKNWMDIYDFDQETSKYISTFIISGGIQVIKMWMAKGMVQSPKEMARLINDLINKGVESIR
ncbi:TetR/AcrR family transcriptional regulator C-terminal domain-containing protein [Ornithinibacillus massiliensis]|uniref:TetR/AcrR family transcriptional regulator C-terminal domain-containing protein n=1 Tax=Ornithinibacillus massiliensis TaxID=1944633 RepID=A0ABS5MGM1_9BACI|nr:TetR-like C-terminal domain-containing protein [Ornithinibacillus massiliensis]MBS3680868.1 TetR/AcrR family transcriptional regulator C-terminal domain-containing protein [Ornithinibacillus massiliensis]